MSKDELIKDMNKSIKKIQDKHRRKIQKGLENIGNETARIQVIETMKEYERELKENGIK